MFAFSSRPLQRAVMEGERVYLRHPELSDFDEWAFVRERNRDFLQAWEPRWHRDDLTKPAFKNRLSRYRKEIRDGYSFPFFICDIETSRLLGGITVGHIRRGVAQSGQIGYWLAENDNGKGLMGEALRLTVEFGFQRLGLHRLEAACLPTNLRSRNLLERNGFAQEGLLRSYLKINGAWRDHLLYARINPLQNDKN